MREIWTEKGLLKELERQIRIARETVLDPLDAAFMTRIIGSTLDLIAEYRDTHPTSPIKKHTYTSEKDLLLQLEAAARRRRGSLRSMIEESAATLDRLDTLRSTRIQRAADRAAVKTCAEVRYIFGDVDVVKSHE